LLFFSLVFRLPGAGLDVPDPPLPPDLLVGAFAGGPGEHVPGQGHLLGVGCTFAAAPRDFAAEEDDDDAEEAAGASAAEFTKPDLPAGAHRVSFATRGCCMITQS